MPWSAPIAARVTLGLDYSGTIVSTPVQAHRASLMNAP
jgi:hypothetical protein